MYRKLLFLSIIIVGIFFAIAVFAQTCPHIYEGINCGANWYCNGCQTTCKTCPSGGDPIGATVLNYVNCTCGCPSGQIVCAGACTTAPACSTPTREQNNSSCNGCGVCKSGYAPDPSNPNPPNPCLKAAYIDYPNTGYFQVSGDLKSTSGDLYLASGKAIRVDGAGTTTLNIANYAGTTLNTTLEGGLIVKGVMDLTSMGAGTINAEKLCIAGDCRDVWPAAVSAFVQGGNTFGALAVLGTNDTYDLAVRTAGVEKMRVTTGGNVGIGTASPAYKLDVSGQIYAQTSSATAITGYSTSSGGTGIYGWASDTSAANYGGFFISNGPGGQGVYGFANGAGGIGVHGLSPNSSGYGIYGAATAVSGTNYGVYGTTYSSSGWAGYFTGGRGAYADRLVAGSAIDPGIYRLYVVGDANITGNLTVGSGSAGNDDYIYFDDGSARYLKWNDAQSRFELNSNSFIYGFLSTAGGNISATGGYYVQAYNNTNQAAVIMQHDGTNGVIEPSGVSGDYGNLVLRSNYAGRYVLVQDDLGVDGGMRVGAVGNMGYGTVNASQLCINGTCQSSWPSGGVPGGSSTYVQYNNGGAFGGDAGLTYNSGTSALAVGGLASVGSLKVGALGGILTASSGYVSATGAPLAISYGGTNSTVSPTAGGIAYGNGSAYTFTGAGSSGQFLQSNGTGAPTWATISGGVSGSGSTNYVAKFTGATSVGSSLIYDNGTNIQIVSGNLGIGFSPIYKLDVNGTSYLGGDSMIAGNATVSGDLIANNNTPSGCAWTSYAASVTCPNGQFVSGVRYSASTVSAYCCEL